MAEKMLVAQALDERDLLKKKINDKISKLLLVDYKKRNNENTGMTMMDSELFSKCAKAGYQQVKDLIDRYMRLNAAIIASNAATMIETPWNTMSVANAIAIRSRLRKTGTYDSSDLFELNLVKQLKNQYDMAVSSASVENKKISDQAESMRMAILGRDQKTKDDKPLEVVEAYVRENTAEILDPVGAMEQMQEWKEYIENFLTEIDTRIKVSNATTTIEF